MVNGSDWPAALKHHALAMPLEPQAFAGTDGWTRRQRKFVAYLCGMRGCKTVVNGQSSASLFAQTWGDNFGQLRMTNSGVGTVNPDAITKTQNKSDRRCIISGPDGACGIATVL